MLDRFYKLGGIATPIVMLISVLFVVEEMQRNTSAIHTSTSQNLVALQIQLDEWTLKDAKVQWWLDNAGNELDGAEQPSVQMVQAERWVRNKINLFEHAYFSHLNGALNEKVFKGWNHSYTAFFCKHALAQGVFKKHKESYADDLIDHVNDITNDLKCDK
jgi:hypothetical protein